MILFGFLSRGVKLRVLWGVLHIIIKGELNLSSLKAYVWNARPATVRCKGEQKVRNEGVMRITKVWFQIRGESSCKIWIKSVGMHSNFSVNEWGLDTPALTSYHLNPPSPLHLYDVLLPNHFHVWQLKGLHTGRKSRQLIVRFKALTRPLSTPWRWSDPWGAELGSGPASFSLLPFPSPWEPGHP